MLTISNCQLLHNSNDWHPIRIIAQDSSCWRRIWLQERATKESNLLWLILYGIMQRQPEIGALLGYSPRMLLFWELLRGLPLWHLWIFKEPRGLPSKGSSPKVQSIAIKIWSVHDQFLVKDPGQVQRSHRSEEKAYCWLSRPPEASTNRPSRW